MGPGHKLVIDQARAKEQARYDGKFVVHSDDDTLSAQDMALGYKQRSMFHRAAHPIHASVALSVPALLLERAAEYACADTWRNIRDDLKTVKLAQWLSPHGTVWQVTDPSPAAAKRLKSLNIKPPAPILNVT